MQFEFSANFDQIPFHVCAYQNTVLPRELVDQDPHKHFFPEFHGVLQGEETVFFPKENRKLSVKQGQILLIPPNTYHSIRTENGSVQRLCFNFSTDAGDSVHHPILTLMRRLNQPHLFRDPIAFELLRQSGTLSDERLPFSDFQQGSLLFSLVFRLFGFLSDGKKLPDRQSSRQQKQKWIIEEYLDRHFTDREGIEGLSRDLFLSQRQTRTLVHRFFGEDFKTLIIRRRMELAEILLSTTDLSLEKIAWKTGYLSYSGFQLAFKQHFGKTPSQIKKELFSLSNQQNKEDAPIR